MNNYGVPHKVSGNEWRKLAEFELLAGQAQWDTIQIQLTEVLVKLQLEEEFLNKVLKSAQKSTAHFMGVQMPSDWKMHLLIFAPGEYKSNGKSWGFFRTEKFQGPRTESGLQPTMAFYLYPEG
jgi:hypothetical protein